MQEVMDASDVKKLLAGGYVGPRPAPYALDSIEIELPLPPQATRPNAGGQHWRKKANAIKQQRDDSATAAKIALQGKGPPLWERVAIQATFYRPGNRDRASDADNLIAWLKATADGLQGIIVANDRGVTWLPPVQLIGKDAEGDRKLVLVIQKV